VSSPVCWLDVHSAMSQSEGLIFGCRGFGLYARCCLKRPDPTSQKGTGIQAASRRTVPKPQDDVEEEQCYMRQVEVTRKWEPSAPREITIKSDWAGVLDAAPTVPVLRQFDEHEIYLVQNLFSAEECDRLIQESERHGFGTTSYLKSYRGNLRLITIDRSLAEAVWRRLQPVMPTTVSCDGVGWDVVGLNECWRLAKYCPGDRFQGHCDDCFERSSKERSMFTVNIYMNGGFEGGSTRFYLNNLKNADLSVLPETGLCLVFRQPPGKEYYHDGELLQSGVKYLFRSDVMYQRQECASV